MSSSKLSIKNYCPSPLPCSCTRANHADRWRLVIFVLLVLALIGGCAAKKPATPPEQPKVVRELRDIRDFPQNLLVYAQKAGLNREILDAASQNMLDAKFNSIFFGPWDMSSTSIRKREPMSLFGRARGYKANGIPWNQLEWNDMRVNANLDSFPSRAHSGIIVRNSDLRELPTHEARLADAPFNLKENPFDYFQYSLLPLGTPVLVAHASRDGCWYYIECPITGGWVDAADVALVDDEFKQLWRQGKYAALIRDKVPMPGTGPRGADGQAGIGTVLPFGSHNSDKSLNVLVPVKGPDNMARTAEIILKPEDAIIKPMPLTAGNVAKVGNAMMGQPYGWGGTNGQRDCSATIRDLFTPFGVWLPRNSQAQARRGIRIPLSGLSAAEKNRIILQKGVPFFSLLTLRGHITLYVGEWQGRPAIFHNAWGLRIVKDGNDNERFVIGKAVVTSTMPGIELEELYRPVTFVDRLHTLTLLGSK